MNQLKYLLVITTLVLCNTARATPWQETEPMQRWYYGLGIGMSLMAYNENNLVNQFAAATSASTYNSDDFTFRLFGGYRFDPFLALEFGFSELGNTIANTNGATSKLFNTYTAYIDATMSREYNRNAQLYGKLGAHFWNIGPDASSTLADGTDLSIGLGFEFNIYGGTERVMRVEWERFLFDNVYLDTADTLTLNLVFKL